MTISA